MDDEYISREAVMQKFADHVKRSNNSDFASVPTWNQAVQIVEDIPTVDVQPVRHGWFTPANRRPRTWQFKCSECGDIAYFPQPKYFSMGCGYSYCPNCGAKMDLTNNK